MARLAAVALALTALAGCGVNPFVDTVPAGIAKTLPGTSNPSPDRSISRQEPTTEQDPSADLGNGYAQAFTANTDGTYSVDNLGFDGANVYTASAPKPIPTPYGIYESAAVIQDAQTGVPISQFQHRLIAGKSTSGQGEFAIVRTGSYTGYGFGGFVMKRNGGVNLPSTGQAAYSGQYTGLRDFSGRGGLEYTTGDMDVAIDFEDFNKGDAVQGHVRNRKIYDLSGTDITASYVGAMNAEYNKSGNSGLDRTTLPVLNFKVGPGAIDSNGEINGSLDSNVVRYSTTTATVETFESGKYYAIVSGDTANEIVGVIVVKSTDPYFQNVSVRETGGFLLYRP